jgi:hypothetical protein
MSLRSLADVRTLLSHLPKETRAKDTWQVVATALKEAAAGADPTDVTVALQLVLMLGKGYVQAEVKPRHHVPEPSRRCKS